MRRGRKLTRLLPNLSPALPSLTRSPETRLPGSSPQGGANSIIETLARPADRLRPIPGCVRDFTIRQRSGDTQRLMSRILIAMLLPLLIAACGGGSGSSEAREYIDDLAPFLVPAANAKAEWADFQQRLSAVSTDIPRQESQALLVEQIDLAKRWLSVTHATLVRMETIRPPDQCLDVHRTTLDSLQVLSDGVKLIVQWSEAALDGRQNPDDLAQSDRLLSESDRMGLQAETQIASCR